MRVPRKEVPCRAATSRNRGALLLVTAFWALPVLAVPIPVSSYTITTPPEVSYVDSTGKQLTDGIFGDPNINGGSSNWVGWINSSGAGPNAIFITFNFGSVQTITSATIDFLRLEQNFVFLPDSVSVGGQSFPVDPNALANGSSSPLTFTPSAPLNTQTLQIELDRAGTGFHILIDEVTFDGIGSTGPSTPEPSTLGMVGGMLVLAMVGQFYRSFRSSAKAAPNS